jgi:hypothetical protein
MGRAQRKIPSRAVIGTRPLAFGDGGEDPAPLNRGDELPALLEGGTDRRLGMLLAIGSSSAATGSSITTSRCTDIWCQAQRRRPSLHWSNLRRDDASVDKSRITG